MNILRRKGSAVKLWGTVWSGNGVTKRKSEQENKIQEGNNLLLEKDFHSSLNHSRWHIVRHMEEQRFPKQLSSDMFCNIDNPMVPGYLGKVVTCYLVGLCEWHFMFTLHFSLSCSEQAETWTLAEMAEPIQPVFRSQMHGWRGPVFCWLWSCMAGWLMDKPNSHIYISESLITKRRTQPGTT